LKSLLGWLPIDHSESHTKPIRDRARFNLRSDQGARLSTQRNADAESVFGGLKNNLRLIKFLVRGKELANVDWGILFIAHSIAKLAAVWFRQFLF
jgi:hypothetical protein